MSIFDIFRKKKKISTPWKKYYTDIEFEINLPNISLYEQIKRCSERFDEEYAYEYFGKKVGYQKFLKKIDRAALAFKRLKVNKGDVVSICLPNVPEALIAFYALNKLGAVASMIHPLSAEEEIKTTLMETKSKYLIVLDSLYPKIKKSIKSTYVNKVIFVSASYSMPLPLKIGYRITQFGKNRHPITKYYINWKMFNKLSIKVKKDFQKFGKNQPCVILHSGGTSGKPKNVVLQNRAFLLLTEQPRRSLQRLNAGDSCLTIMPNFHGFGLGVCMHGMITNGIRSILVPQFDSKKFDVLLNKTKPNFIVGVPTLYEALINSKNISNLDLSYVKYVISGGDSLSGSLEDEVNLYLESHGANAKITQGYGLTEALSVVTLCSDERSKKGSIGIPLAGSDVKIINPSTRKTVKYGEDGEICVHSKALMMGYLNNEKETNESLQIHDDGHIWLHTGDLGSMDKDGFVFYKGRAKRMIITSGYNVYPSHIEEVIESHPAVLQCTVVGVPHPYKKEVPKAFIVLKEGFHGFGVKNDIKEHCKKNLARYMMPKDFVYRKNLPKTKIGKVDFQKLKGDDGVDDI